MAKYKVESIEESTNGDVYCDTFVYNNKDEVIGHFTVVLDADEILAASGTKAQRIAVYKAMFFSDNRIGKTISRKRPCRVWLSIYNYPRFIRLSR